MRIHVDRFLYEAVEIIDVEGGNHSHDVQDKLTNYSITTSRLIVSGVTGVA